MRKSDLCHVNLLNISQAFILLLINLSIEHTQIIVHRMKMIFNFIEVRTTIIDVFYGNLLGDLLIVHEHLSNGWLRGSLHFNLPGTSFRPTGIFPNTFVTLVNERTQQSKYHSFFFY